MIEEHERLAAALGQHPPGGVLVRLEGLTTDANKALNEMRSLYEAIFDPNEPRAPSPLWMDKLPDWLVQSFDAQSNAEIAKEAWLLEAWVLSTQERVWKWWASGADDHRVSIDVWVIEHPYSVGSLAHALRASGCHEVRVFEH